MTNEEAKEFLDNLKICINEHPIVADWLVEITNRKTEPTISKMEQVDEPTTQMKTQNSNLTFEKADEPQTEEWYTYQDEQEYNEKWQTDCPWK